MLTQPAIQSPAVTRQVPAFTGIRAVAAYAVFLHHYNPAPAGTFGNRLLAQGYVGVSVFFVLSGFLIYHRYADAYFTRIGWSWRVYLQNRFARIFPLYFLLLLATVLVNTRGGRPMSLFELILNLTLLKGLFEDYKFSGIAQSWSLTVELCFYLLAPPLFLALRRWGAVRLTAGLVGTGFLLGAVTGLIRGPDHLSSLSFGLFYTFFGRAFEFVVGLWLARRWHEGRLPAVTYATSSGWLLLSSCVFWQAVVSAFVTNAAGLWWSEVIVYNYGLPLSIGLIFVGLLREKSAIRRLLAHPILQALGRSSYAFYLIHIGVLAKGFYKMGLTHAGLLFILLILLAHGLYVAIEKPLLRRLRAFSERAT